MDQPIPHRSNVPLIRTPLCHPLRGYHGGKTHNTFFDWGKRSSIMISGCGGILVENRHEPGNFNGH